MKSTTLETVEEQLRQLPPDKLAVVADFVAFLRTRWQESNADLVMKASEDALKQFWDLPEEDETWAHL
jgi:hypothetical protein